MGACNVNSIDNGNDPSNGKHPYQYDSYSLIPGLISTFFLVMYSVEFY